MDSMDLIMIPLFSVISSNHAYGHLWKKMTIGILVIYIHYAYTLEMVPKFPQCKVNLIMQSLFCDLQEIHMNSQNIC